MESTALMESMEEQRMSSRLILVAINESKESINALQWALNNLFTSHDRVILIHAQRDPISLLVIGNPGLMLPARAMG